MHRSPYSMVCSQASAVGRCGTPSAGMVPVLHRKLQQGHLTHSSSSLFAAQAAHGSLCVRPDQLVTAVLLPAAPRGVPAQAAPAGCPAAAGTAPGSAGLFGSSPLFGEFFLSPLKIILDKSRDVCYSIPCCWTAVLTSAGVAQPVEQLICNQQVGGSNPSTSSTISYGGVPEWPKGADCKSVAFRFGGSNPTLLHHVAAKFTLRPCFLFSGQKRCRSPPLCDSI